MRIAFLLASPEAAMNGPRESYPLNPMKHNLGFEKVMKKEKSQISA